MDKHAALGRVMVLMGGWSSEREVSLKSGQAVLDALLAAGVNAFACDPQKDTMISEIQAQSPCRIFIALHGEDGESGVLQGALDLLGIPYTGSDMAGCVTSWNKLFTKQLWHTAALPIADYQVLSESSTFDAVAETLGTPFFVKSAAQGSSVGTHCVQKASEYLDAFADAKKQDAEGLVLAEKALLNGEYAVSILDGKALPPVQIKPKHLFYDYSAKCDPSAGTEWHLETDLTVDEQVLMETLALKAFEVCRARGWGRIDFLRGSDGQLYLNECNTVPGITPLSLFPRSAKAAGFSFEEALLKILSLTL